MGKRKDREDPKQAKDKDAFARSWRQLIEDACEREKKWRKKAQEILRIYEEDDCDVVPFNILYANTETLAPALFNSNPRPDTRPRSKVPNALVDAAAGLIDSYLENFIDSGDERYPAYSTVCSQAVLEALLPGRGLVRFHYKAEVKKAEDGAPVELIDESVFAESVAWDKIRFGYSTSWETMPWLAFEHNFTQEEAEAELGADVASKLTYETPKMEDGDKGEVEGAQVATVFEVWDKVKRKVYWIEEQASAHKNQKPVLKEQDDPYKLQGFYPVPKPLEFFSRVKKKVPVPLYKLYEQQARELNRITRRITHLIEGMKIRGFYDSNVDGLQKLFDTDDNTLIALTQLAALGQGAKAENAIWLVPVDKHATVLNQLLQNRQAILQTIYQVMGIADIMRGSSVASETLGAQEIKNKWGTLRLKRAQKATAEFIRDGLRIAAELAFTLMSPRNLRMLTGSQLPTEAEHAQLEQAVQAAAQAGQPVPDEIKGKLALPNFEECVNLLKTDILRRYAIDIETNSTVDAEASEDKENMADFLNAFSQFLNGLFPMVEAGVLPPDVIKGIMITLSRRFRMGRDLDPYLQKIGQASPSGAAQKKQLDEQAKQLQDASKKIEAEGQKVQSERQKLEKDKASFQVEQMKAEVSQIKTSLMKEVKDAKAKATLEQLLIRIETAMARAAQPQPPKEQENAAV